MRSAVIVLFLVALSALIVFFGFSRIVAPIAHAAVVLVPAIFTISLIIGFASRRHSWF